MTTESESDCHIAIRSKCEAHPYAKRFALSAQITLVCRSETAP